MSQTLEEIHNLREFQVLGSVITNKFKMYTILHISLRVDTKLGVIIF